MYALVQTGGKQYRVEPGDVIRVEKVSGADEPLALDQVLMLVRDDGTTVVGSPTVDGAVVRASVVEQGRGRKIRGLKYKAKVNYRRHYGHRQAYTELRIDGIEG